MYTFLFGFLEVISGAKGGLREGRIMKVVSEAIWAWNRYPIYLVPRNFCNYYVTFAGLQRMQRPQRDQGILAVEIRIQKMWDENEPDLIMQCFNFQRS